MEYRLDTDRGCPTPNDLARWEIDRMFSALVKEARKRGEDTNPIVDEWLESVAPFEALPY